MASRYKSITLREELSITEFISLHYFEYPKDFVFTGESHDFWEFVCVDSGTIEVTADSQKFLLTKNQMIFHKPNEFHALRADGITAPNLIVASFRCHASCMQFFENRIVTINNNDRFYLGRMLAEGQRTFVTPLNDPHVYQLTRGKDPEFGCEQMIKLSLESLLISLYRRNTKKLLPKENDTKSSFLLFGEEDDAFSRVLHYLQENIYGHVTVAQICKANSIGRSQLQKLFHDRADCGVIDYFNRMKIEKAQNLIRMKTYNYTQIADYLSYSSYQYFLAQFKKYAGMTPSEYNHSIKSFSDNEWYDESSH